MVSISETAGALSHRLGDPPPRGNQQTSSFSPAGNKGGDKEIGDRQETDVSSARGKHLTTGVRLPKGGASVQQRYVLHCRHTVAESYVTSPSPGGCEPTSSTPTHATG